MTVTKMNGIAAWRFFIAREVSTQRCSGGCVNRRWIGFSEDDVGNRRRREYQTGKPHANALRTTRSILAILRDDAALLSLAENRSAESIMGGSASPKTMLTIAEGADIRRVSRMPTR